MKPSHKSSENIWQKVQSDLSARGLILSNLIIIVIALIQSWDLATLMVVYWCQSVIIGLFTVLRILTVGFASYDKKLKGPPPFWAKAFMAGFFIAHYGGFHLGYYSFLNSFFKKISPSVIIPASLIFFLNHLFSFLYNKAKDPKRQSLDQIFFVPYKRIVPMHLTIIFGMSIMMLLGNALAEKIALIIFLYLKMTVDVKMHLAKHTWGFKK